MCDLVKGRVQRYSSYSTEGGVGAGGETDYAAIVLSERRRRSCPKCVSTYLERRRQTGEWSLHSAAAAVTLSCCCTSLQKMLSFHNLSLPTEASHVPVEEPTENYHWRLSNRLKTNGFDVILCHGF